MASGAPIGLIGLGLMGGVFAQRLMAAGFGVMGFDIDAQKRERLAEAGGQAAPSVAELARSCDVTIVVVFNTDQVETVLEHEFLPAVGDASNKIVLCASTADPDRLAALGARVTARGLRFLEAPVSGTSEQVRRGEGVGLIGGDRALMDEAKPVIDALYPRSFHIGRHGDGSRAKLAINLILGVNRTVLAEGLVFAERLGLDPATFLDVAKTSAAYSQVMENKGPKMIRGDFSPEGMVQISLKDANMMLDQARKHDLRLSLTQTYRDILEACRVAGQAELDNSSVIAEVRRRRP